MSFFCHRVARPAFSILSLRMRMKITSKCYFHRKWRRFVNRQTSVQAKCVDVTNQVTDATHRVARPTATRQSPNSPTVIAHTPPCHSGIEDEQAAKPSRSTCFGISLFCHCSPCLSCLLPFATHTAVFLSPLFTVAFSIPPLKTLAVH